MLKTHDILGNHPCQTMLGRRGRIFTQQGVGLRNRGQGVADFVGNAGRHPAHGCELVLALSCTHDAQILQPEHAHVFGVQGLVPTGKADAYAQLSAVAVVKTKQHFLSGFRLQRGAHSLFDGLNQSLPCGDATQLKGGCGGEALGAQQAACGRIGAAHTPLAVEHQHTFAHFLHDQAIELGLLASQFKAAACAALFSRHAGCQFAGQRGNRKQAESCQTGFGQVGGQSGGGRTLDPGRRKQIERSNRRHGERHHPGHENACHQHWQGKQGLGVERGAREMLKHREEGEVEAHAEQGLTGAQRRRCAWRQLTLMGHGGGPGPHQQCHAGVTHGRDDPDQSTVAHQPVAGQQPQQHHRQQGARAQKRPIGAQIGEVGGPSFVRSRCIGLCGLPGRVGRIAPITVDAGIEAAKPWGVGIPG